jgi:hypothetical protein
MNINHLSTDEIPGILIFPVRMLKKVTALRNHHKYTRLFIGSEEGLIPISTESQRYKLFRKNKKCVKCGKEGNVVSVMKTFQKDCNQYRFHLNLYHIGKNEKPLLMTKDHIVPKSKGGPNKMSNYQTMCTKCNQKKGNIIENESNN